MIIGKLIEYNYIRGQDMKYLLPVVSKSSIGSTCRNGLKTRPSAVLLLAAETQ